MPQHAVRETDSTPQPAHWDAQSALAQRRRILIAEDEQEMREFVDRVLRDAGYETARVIDGQEALEVTKLCGSYDLLLTDLVMPRMSGTELANRLRQFDPTIKVLYFTGHCDRLFEQKGALWNDEAFLEKPSSIEELLETVSLLLKGDHMYEPGPLGGHRH